MRLLIVNPNTSAGVTRRIADAAAAVARPGDRFTTRPAAFGPELIVTAEDGAEAARGVIETIRRAGETPDGIILASFGDTGAEEVRKAWPDIPVIGIAEAAFAAARRIGGPFSIVTFAPEVAPPLREKAIQHGAGDALLRVAALEDPLQGDPADVAETLFAPLAALCATCARDGARSIVLGGGPLAGLASRIAPECPVPVIDGTQEAIAQLRARVAGTPADPTTRRYPA
ncbi:aspartate/glutamate racemase family protein [Roseobacter sinensis]|uniref:Aspartate/glutamate racemase family protein n=1 Tax=Roseobacter sinensis TaxID=2931391 RepID=A0ABT3BJB0_9RHOB|nr:aspartate/glutamate racemase family protein [Roseobacter sp. WL0113]MCV3273444.1 aspartate/glutamate racemase family protein [Roseobacter sp. WL0113]